MKRRSKSTNCFSIFIVYVLIISIINVIAIEIPEESRNYVLNEDLTGKTNGTDANGISGWEIAQRPDTSDSATFQNGAVQIYRSGKTTGTAEIRVAKNLPVVEKQGKVVYEFSVYYQSPGASNYATRFLKLYAGNINGVPLFDTYFDSNSNHISPFLVSQSEDGKEIIQIPTSAYAAWYIYQYVLDYSKGTYRIYINDSPVVSTRQGADIAIPTSFLNGGPVNAFEIDMTCNSEAYPETICIKDFKVYKIVTPPAETTKIYHIKDDFSSYTEGTNAQGLNGWGLYGKALDSITVQEGGIKFIRNASIEAGDSRVYKTIEGVPKTGKITYEFKAKYSDVYDGYYSTRFCKLYAGPNGINGTSLFGTWVDMEGGHSRILIQTPGSEINIVDVESTVPVWHNYKYVLDYEKGTFNIFYDGVQFTNSGGVADLPMPAVFTTDAVNAFEFAWATNSTVAKPREMIIKDFSVYAVIETANNAVTIRRGTNDSVYAELFYTAPVPIEAVLVLAAFDEKGMLKGVESVTSSLAKIGEIISIRTKEIEVPIGYSYRAFAWNNLNFMTPLLPFTAEIIQ